MSKNDITGDDLRTKAASEAYRDNFDTIFRPLCTDCGKRQSPGQIHTCSPKSLFVGSSIMEDQKNEN